jgi:signal transduction histidine kinase
VVFWHADEQAKAGEEQLQAALWEGQSSVRARLEETERIRTDLIGTVSHEFRTPLTGIRGAALTLLKRGDRLDEAGRKQLLQAVLDQQERLSRLLENMLTAARATSADPSAVTEVHAVATEVVMLAGAARPDSPRVAVVVEPGAVARMDRHALHQVLANLVDNAQQHGSSNAVPLVAGGRDGDEVWVAVSNEGGALDPAAARYLFEPFTQGDAGPTRAHEGLGMGLYVVRRLLEVYGGTVTVRAEAGWVTVEIRLKAVDVPAGLASELAQEPTALPIR